MESESLPENSGLLPWSHIVCWFFDTVAQLRAGGLNVRRLQDGFPEWKRAGMPVETAD